MLLLRAQPFRLSVACPRKQNTVLYALLAIIVSAYEEVKEDMQSAPPDPLIHLWKESTGQAKAPHSLTSHTQCLSPLMFPLFP